MKGNKYLYLIVFIAVNGGLLFGLNMAGISGAVSSIQGFFSLSDSSLGVVVSSLTLGCLFGALTAGKLADVYGRKKVLILSSLLFTASAVLSYLSGNYSILIMARVLGGLAVGIVSVVGPMYISEISPANKRGVLVSFNQFAITIGILLAYVINYMFSGFEDSWRLMLGFPAVFGILFSVLLITVFPESPRWLLSVNRKDEALTILERVGVVKGSDEYAEIMKSESVHGQDAKVSIFEIFKGRVGYVVLLGTILAALQQVTGINAVVSYAPVIFAQANLGQDQALFQSILVGMINFLSTIFALWLIEKAGRKALLLWGTAGMSVSLAVIVLSFIFGWNETFPYTLLTALMLYIAFFAASLAPVMWVVTAEIFPNRVRAVALSFSTGVSWIGTTLVVQLFPLMLNSLGGQWVFGIFGVFSLLGFFFIKHFIPETKGKSLEQIEKELKLA